MEDVRQNRGLRKYVPFVLTTAVGAAVTLAVFFVFLGQEQTRLRSDFESMAADRAAAIRSALSEDQVELNLVADYVSASSELSRGDAGPFLLEFGRLARRVSLREEDVQAIAYIASVSPAELAAFEALMRKTVDSGFTVHENAPGGAARPPAGRARMFPIAVMEPEQYSGSLLGLDVSSVPPLWASLQHAISSGDLTASAAVDLPLSASGPQVIWNFRAIQRAARSSDTTSSRTGLLGICAVAFRIDQMVELSLKPLQPAGIDLELRDADAPPASGPLYYHHSRAPGYDASNVVKTGIRWLTTIDAGERTWILTAYPTSDFVARHRSGQSWLIMGGGVLFTALLGLIFWGRLRRTTQVEAQVTQRTQELAQEISKHEALERALADSRSTLTAQLTELNDKNRQIELLNETGDALQSCLTTEEACATVTVHAPRLLPGTSGALFVNDSQKGLFGSVAEWGERRTVTPAFKAEDCWALRRGKPHAVTQTSANLPCPHAVGDGGGPSLCVPLAGSGRTIGLLHVTGRVESLQVFAESVAEHIGLALSNIMLRSDLRQLSIHDPLTGLYNRRYMEETLETEIRRSERKPRTIGVIMLDIDHFKAFNDGFGHAAGDQMLRAIGGLVMSRLRAGDIACRFGGEELVLILPEASVEAAAHRAEDLRAGAKKLEVKHLDTPLGQVTISLGVAVYPAHGAAWQEVLASADAALYKAKQDGRDRVVVYLPEPAGAGSPAGVNGSGGAEKISRR
jgi:diguanylate cyclase (GGDEF)-like protein